jgi:ABC-2 type transport system permease protein
MNQHMLRDPELAAKKPAVIVALPSEAVRVAARVAPTTPIVRADGDSPLTGLVQSLARRDHADRSVEFWLSLPTSHTASLAAPLVTHLLLVPAAALVLGLAGGTLASAVLVTRFEGFGAWLALPWGALLAAALSLVLRVIAGLPLALLWASPIVLAVVLANAYLKRWGLPALVLGVSLVGLLASRYMGEGAVPALLSDVLHNAARALATAAPQTMKDEDGRQVLQAIAHMPGWALGDFVAALKALAQPLFAGCVLVAAALFALLLDWRRRGASAAQ